MLALLTSADVLARLRISRSTLRRWVKSGKLPAHRTPFGRLRFDPAEVDRALPLVQERDADDALHRERDQHQA
jgi:excisionase family DNA binding protein